MTDFISSILFVVGLGLSSGAGLRLGILFMNLITDTVHKLVDEPYRDRFTNSLVRWMGVLGVGFLALTGASSMNSHPIRTTVVASFAVFCFWYARHESRNIRFYETREQFYQRALRGNPDDSKNWMQDAS